MTPLRILIADDHPLFRKGMRTLLDTMSELTPSLVDRDRSRVGQVERAHAGPHRDPTSCGDARVREGLLVQSGGLRAEE